MTAKSKERENDDVKEEIKTDEEDKLQAKLNIQIHDFMPKWGKDEKRFKKAVVRDITTEKQWRDADPV